MLAVLALARALARAGVVACRRERERLRAHALPVGLLRRLERRQRRLPARHVRPGHAARPTPHRRPVICSSCGGNLADASYTLPVHVRRRERRRDRAECKLGDRDEREAERPRSTSAACRPACTSASTATPTGSTTAPGSLVVRPAEQQLLDLPRQRCRAPAASAPCCRRRRTARHSAPAPATTSTRRGTTPDDFRDERRLRQGRQRIPSFDGKGWVVDRRRRRLLRRRHLVDHGQDHERGRTPAPPASTSGCGSSTTPARSSARAASPDRPDLLGGTVRFRRRPRREHGATTSPPPRGRRTRSHRRSA